MLHAVGCGGQKAPEGKSTSKPHMWSVGSFHSGRPVAGYFAINYKQIDHKSKKEEEEENENWT